MSINLRFYLLMIGVMVFAGIGSLIFVGQVQAGTCGGSLYCATQNGDGSCGPGHDSPRSCSGGDSSSCDGWFPNCPCGVAGGQGCAWNCTGDTSDQGCAANGCGVGTRRICTCSGDNNWSCSCVGDASCNAAPTPTATPVPGCSPGGCDTSNCSGVCQGNACGSNGCGTCSTGTKVCTPPPPSDIAPIGYHDVPDNASCTLHGWACDQDLWSAALRVDFWILGSPNVPVTSVVANSANEPAVTALCGNTSPHRFNTATLPVIYQDGAPHSITAFGIGIDSSGAVNGNNPPLSSNPQTITCANRIGGRIVSCANTATAIPGVTVDVYDDAKKLDAAAGHTFPVTNASGYYTSTYVNRGNVYAVRPPNTPPTGYQGPPKARGSFGSNPMGWTWNNCTPLDTALNSQSYECQVAGTNDCGGNSPNGDDRCGFCYDVCTPPAVPGVTVTNTDTTCDAYNVQNTGTAVVSWGSGTYDIMRYPGSTAPSNATADTLTPIALAKGSPFTYTDSTATCTSTYVYGVRATNAYASCSSSHSYKWGNAVTIKCNPTTPTAPTPVSGSYKYITVNNFPAQAGDTLYRAHVGPVAPTPTAPAVSPAPTPPYSGASITLDASNHDTGVTCDDVAAATKNYYFYAARRARGTGVNACYANSVASIAANCLAYPDWFLTDVGDVTSENNITSKIPATATTKKFADGVVLGNTTDLGAAGTAVFQADMPDGAVQSIPVANSVLTSNNYASLLNRVQSKGITVPTVLGTISNISSITSVATLNNGWYYAQYSGTAALPALALAAGQKVMFFVNGGVNINGNITVADATSEFVLISTGNMTVATTVGVSGDPTPRAPELSGIFMTDGIFDTNTSTSPDGGINFVTLRMSGIVIGQTDVNIRRSSTGTYPKFFIHYRPEYLTNLPASIKETAATYDEVAP